MKNKVMLVITILLLAVGFAAISTTLIINGTAKVGENTDDFSVIFTKATLDGTDVYENVISQDKKTVTFETNDLKTLNQTSVLTYEVTNNSANYDAEVQVNCKVKDNTEAKYTSIKNELENNATVVKAKESVNGTLTVNLEKVATDEVKEQYVCTLELNAVERENVQEHKNVFATDSWATIAANVRDGNIDQYDVGDTKEVNLGSLGTFDVRVSNKSECTNGETSETACGFVVEFVDTVAVKAFNSADTNVGGWKNSYLHTYVNNDIYNALPSDLQNVIATTKVTSGHGSTSGETNFETQDKLYLLSSEEIWGNFASSTYAKYDTAVGTSRQLDYYKNLGVLTGNTNGAIKNYKSYSGVNWYLRSANSVNATEFLYVASHGGLHYVSASTLYCVSPAFRIA